MGITHAELQLANDARSDLEPINATARVDTNMQHLCIPETMALLLQLKDSGSRAVLWEDGHTQQARYVSPVRIEMMGRVCVVGALVLGEHVTLGSIAMDDLDLILDPVTLRVTVNPISPNMPRSVAKGHRTSNSEGGIDCRTLRDREFAGKA